MLKIFYKFKHDSVQFKSGHFYKFKYDGYENDPNPTIVLLYAIKGIHPKTGNQWNLMQALNLNYIPKKDRKIFVKIWKKHMEKTKSIKLTWHMITKQYPYLKASIRRYLLKPKYYVRKCEAISFDDIDKEVVKSWHKDYSSVIKRKFASKMKRLFVGSKKNTKKSKKKKKGWFS